MSFKDALEDRILGEANEEWFSGKFDCGTKCRITKDQARCVIRAWVKHVMPGILYEEVEQSDFREALNDYEEDKTVDLKTALTSDPPFDVKL